MNIFDTNAQTLSSVNFEDTVKSGNTVKKGDMLGYFLFGGSDYVMLFQSKAPQAAGYLSSFRA